MIGTVYKVEIGENIYIGSTVLKLNRRQNLHNDNLKKNKNKIKLYEECKKNGITKIILVPLEEKEIEDIDEIRLLEQEYITKLQPSLNHKSSYTGLTHKQYNQQYYENNKEEIKKNMTQYNNTNRKKINEKRRKYRIEHIEEITEKKKENITCPICGFVGRKEKLLRHQKTKKCLSMKQ